MEREPTAEERADVFNPELLPSPSDELSAEAAHSRGCASGNTLAPSSRGITLRARFALNALETPSLDRRKWLHDPFNADWKFPDQCELEPIRELKISGYAPVHSFPHGAQAGRGNPQLIPRAEHAEPHPINSERSASFVGKNSWWRKHCKNGRGEGS
jgi:hypothetical protein